MKKNETTIKHGIQSPEPALLIALADAEKLTASLQQLHRSLCKDKTTIAENMDALDPSLLLAKCRQIRDELKGAQ